jgi:hypothetical protein
MQRIAEANRKSCYHQQLSTASKHEHLAEIAEILALGLMRLRVRKSSQLSADHGESSLHFPPDQSGGVSPATHVQENA